MWVLLNLECWYITLYLRSVTKRVAEDGMAGENLSRMGAAKIQLVADQHGNQVIEKCPVSDVEYSFYEHAADPLCGVIESPRLLHADTHRRSLTLEYVPHKISQEEVAGDDILKRLSRLNDYPAEPG